MRGFPVILLGALAACGPAGCRRDPPPATATAGLPVAHVRVAAVERVIAPVSIETSGTVRAVQRAAIAAKVSGAIESLPVGLGQTVRAGDVLLRISAPEFAARATQARAQLAQIERELARERRLLATGAGPRDAVKSLEDRLAQVQAALREAEALLGYATVRAPFDGTVARKYVEAGDFAAPGAPLLQLDGRDTFVEVGLPDSFGAGLAVGAILPIELVPSGTQLAAALTELSTAADSGDRSVTARLALPAGTAARPGQFVRVTVPGPPAAALLVPASAVSRFGQMERVFTVGADQRAVLRLVRTGALRGDRVEIVSGLDAGERVVAVPPATLREGQPLDLTP